MNELEHDLPTKDTDHVTDLEAALFVCRSFHSTLRRLPNAIRTHAEDCIECKQKLESAKVKLDTDKTKLTDLIRRGTGRAVVQPNGALATSRRRRDYDYAVWRRDAKDPDKQLVASYVADRVPRTDGWGLFVDAGSQCFAAFTEIAKSVDQQDRTQLHLVTSNKFVLDAWEKDQLNERSRFPLIEIAGSEVDVEHRAFYGLSNRGFDSFRPSLVLIGAAGFEVEPGRLWLGTHAGEHEIRDKELLFRCFAKERVILLTPGKIGHAGSKPLNLLNINPAEGPIYIVTAAPKEREDKANYNKAMDAMRSQVMREKLEAQRIRVYWITVHGIDNQSVGQIEEDVFPSKAERTIAVLDTEIRSEQNSRQRMSTSESSKLPSGST